MAGNVELRGRSIEAWALPLFLIIAFAFLYLSLFCLPCMPIFRGGDENIFLLNATRILDGQVMYRDFFELTAPGITALNLGLFKIFGARDWISSASLVVLGLGLTWLIVALSRKVLTGRITFLLAALFLTCVFGPMLDDTHHWYSTFAELGAVLMIIEKRTRARLMVAGALCGLASFFTQTQGALALVGMALFVWWEGRTEGRSRLETIKRAGYLSVPFVATVMATNAYFVWKAGLDPYLQCTVTFVLKYYSAGRDSNSIYALLYDFAQVAHWRALPSLGIFFFVHALPLVYVWFWIRHRRADLAPELDARLMLVSIVGLLACAGVALAPTTYRVSTVTPLGLILFAWLLSEGKMLQRAVTVALWIVVAVAAVFQPLHVQSQQLLALDLPRGRMVVDSTYYEEFQWLSQRTVPGDFLFTAAGLEVLYPLALRDPAEVPYVETTDYTRPERVREVVESLETDRVRFVLWDSAFNANTNLHSKEVPASAIRGYSRRVYRAVKTLLGGDYRPEGDHLGPLRDYLHSHYHIAKRFPGSLEVWERN
jgi:hypothetical protein